MTDPIVLSNGVDTESSETVSFPLPIPSVGVSNVIPVENVVATEDIVGPRANDLIDPLTVNENEQPIEQVPQVHLRSSTRERIPSISDDFQVYLS